MLVTIESCPLQNNEYIFSIVMFGKLDDKILVGLGKQQIHCECGIGHILGSNHLGAI
jgi:hypothetical protein